MEEVLKKLVRKEDLTREEAESSMRFIMSGKASDEQIQVFLLGLKEKGETVTEISAFARILREFAVKVNPKPRQDPRLKTQYPLVDTCGSGGDGIKTFNISTVAAFVAAGAGIPIAKHGNRAVSSKSGSADVLEKLGVKIDLDARGVERCIEKAGIGFMFAPQFHGAMKHVAAVRKRLATRTVFNLLGPLISPAGVKHQVYGIYDPELTEKLAGVLRELGSRHALVVHGVGGLDELSTLGKTKVTELHNEKITTYHTVPAQFGLKTADPEQLAGSDPQENACTLMHILGGEMGPRRDIVVLNAAAAIYVAGAADTIKHAIPIAEESIDSGRALRKLNDLIEVSNA